ncbi:glucose-6-phosphate isomerase [Leisingera daeponensis]|uniref:Glucose-6-phosphate isomerase n=1 Tax=Leisingera daeponensis TaxID=405746 RepID=A0ABS7NLI9_9RHOB|nr:glucose-6-phosphate isomerase [Leisingera daeponensis]MBY6142049.1 glucose-6-phosphate isomerase [Leisingera daeponensis]
MMDIWTKLQENYSAAEGRPIISLFDDPQRFDRFSVEANGLLLDFSKTSIDGAAFDLLLELAEMRDVAGQRDAMFRGERINRSEDRSVLHTALRAGDGGPLVIDGEDVRPGISKTLQAMEDFADGIRSGRIATAGGGAFTDVVNIGIGGSDLGPVMAVRALSPYHNGPRCHFVSNVDGAQISDTLRKLDPRSTLVIIASKTFTTIETMTNAQTAISWLKNGLGSAAASHLAAVSTALEKTAGMGISPERVFGFADWVGGRYSLWGPVGLPVMLAIGPAEFRNFLAGARDMDIHFLTEPGQRNMPLLMGLVGIWHRNICRYSTRAILPYDQRLAKLPAYLQQLDMESNGKRVSISGDLLERDSGPVVWGEAGTNGQHAFYQLLHQGTEIIPAEFLVAARSHEPSLRDHHDLLKANCLAQSEALMLGRSLEQAAEIAAELGFSGKEQSVQAGFRTFPGNRPSLTLAYPLLTPYSLGQIIALYEHRVFVEGAIWGINSFDQWGVELGKELASTLVPMIKGAPADGKDPSTRGLIRALSA